MPLIQVAGISTSGKSTVARELAARGFKAYDTELDGRSAWFNTKTGERATDVGKASARTPQWLRQHAWYMDIYWVQQVAEEAKGGCIFLCGGSNNADEVRAFCDKVIWLATDKDTIRKRVMIPREHSFGTKPHELAAIIEKNQIEEADYHKHGAVLIDARRPIYEVVDKVIAIGSALQR